MEQREIKLVFKNKHDATLIFNRLKKHGSFVTDFGGGVKDASFEFESVDDKTLTINIKEPTYEYRKIKL